MKTERKLYKIGHLTKLLGVTSRTIRYYDQFGLLPHVKRSDGNVRLFDDEDLEVIKKIRHYQKVDFLPLEIIKKRLFGTENSVSMTTQVAVVTDSGGTILEEMSKYSFVKVVPLKIKNKGTIVLDVGSSPKDIWEHRDDKGLFNESELDYSSSEEDILTIYKELASRGFKKIYSIHLSSSLSLTYQNAVNASRKLDGQIEIEVVDSKSIGSAQSLFVEEVIKAISNNESTNQIDILVSKQVRLLYSTMVVDSLRYFSSGKSVFSGQNKCDLSSKLNQFKPVLTLKGGRGEFDIEQICKTREDALAVMLEGLKEEVITRGGYVQNIKISYTYFYAEAKELTNKLKIDFPKTSVLLEEGNLPLSGFIGPEMIVISIN
ncbi:DegV family EDD domain-containing protein [bacterium]|jgi:uncharacterized protein|nr:DegV family EDD domain-containing protein [bacterium]